MRHVGLQEVRQRLPVGILQLELCLYDLPGIQVRSIGDHVSIGRNWNYGGLKIVLDAIFNRPITYGQPLSCLQRGAGMICPVL